MRATKTSLALILCAALCAGAVSAPAQAGPSGAPVADVAAKKKKKKKKKKKCDKRGRSALYNALSCTSLNRNIINSSPTPAGSERYEFCRNGTYRYRKGDFSGDGQFFQTTYKGRWKVINSSGGGSAGLQGAIQYSVTNYVSAFSDGTPAETPPPPVVTQTIVLGPFGTSFAGNTYLFGGTSC